MSKYDQTIEQQEAGLDAEAIRAGLPTVTRMGTIVIRGGVVFIEDDWEFENASCREAARLGLIYALERIQKALTDDVIRNNPTSVRGNAAVFFAE